MMETQTLKEVFDGMLLIEAMFKELNANKNPGKTASLLTEMEKLLPGHRDQIRVWLADGNKGDGK
jgi:hypothetical protein